jgi:hypothetical protein
VRGEVNVSNQSSGAQCLREVAGAHDPLPRDLIALKPCTGLPGPQFRLDDND